MAGHAWEKGDRRTDCPGSGLSVLAVVSSHPSLATPRDW